MKLLFTTIVLLIVCNSCSKRNTEIEAKIEKKTDPIELFVENNVIISHKGTEPHLTIPKAFNEEKIIAIGDGALSRNASFTKITIPNTIELIGRGAFAECSALETIIISDNVRYIGKAPFAACKSLNSIQVSPQNSEFRDINGILFDKQISTLIQYPANAPTSYQVPKSVTTINEAAFAECSKLISVIFPDTLEKIEKAAFLGCSSLEEIDLPKSLKVISQGAFVGCSNLKKITIPKDVTVIEDGAFAHCSNLKSVEFRGPPPLAGNGVFTNSSPTVYVTKNKGWTDSYLNLKTVELAE